MKNIAFLLLILLCPFGLKAQVYSGEVVVTPYKTTMLADGKDTALLRITITDKYGNDVADASDPITFNIIGDAAIVSAEAGKNTAGKNAQGLWTIRLSDGKCIVKIRSGTHPDMIHFEASNPLLQHGETDIITVSPENAALVTIDETYALKGEAAKPRPIDKMLGADISFLPELEAKGVKFSDNGKKKDAIEILKSHGFNYIRLRIFNDPANEKGYSPGEGFCDLKHTKEMARRVKSAGMKLLLDFHYSDTWADPGKQFKPKAWENLSFPDLKKALYDYTRTVMLELQKQNTTPDMVQIGNEINHGILWPDANVRNPNALAQLFSAGTAAVKSVEAKVPIMLHIALGGQNLESVAFIDGMLKRGVHFDVIGESYYPKWHGTPEDLKNNLNDLSKRYHKGVIVVEYSQLKEEVNEIAFNVENGRGKGTCIWEPLSTWEKIFEKDGKSNALLAVYDGINKRFILKKN